MAKKFTKPAPYLVQSDGYPIKAGALWLRDAIKPLMAKRLLTVYYAGLSQKFIPEFIKKHDVCKFFLALKKNDDHKFIVFVDDNEKEMLFYFLEKLVNQNVEIITHLKKISTALW